jgi:hypothetical protein
MAAIDAHAGQNELLSSPYDNAAEITPSDTADLAYATRALWCGAAGNVKVTMLGGGSVTIHHAAHQLLPIRITKVWETGTTNNTDLVALW